MHNSWVIIFSKFTPEALAFEAMLICLLVAGYTAFWVIRKRQLGSVDEVVPVSVIKAYLNELMGDAQVLRTQLFGLLGRGEIAEGQAHAGAITSVTATVADPALLQKIQLLEMKIAEQAKLADGAAREKARIEQELAQAKTQSASGAPSGGDDSSELKARIQALEGKLAEYSIIEDDLANLKRLQQENLHLRNALASAEKSGFEVPKLEPVAGVAAAPAPEPAAALPVAEPVAAAPAEAAPAPNPASAAAAPAPAAEPTDFDQLVNQVEESLQPGPAAAETAVPVTEPLASAIPATEPAAPAPNEAKTDAPPPSDKSDADLVEEFEKMLNA